MRKDVLFTGSHRGHLHHQGPPELTTSTHHSPSFPFLKRTPGQHFLPGIGSVEASARASPSDVQQRVLGRHGAYLVHVHLWRVEEQGAVEGSPPCLQRSGRGGEVLAVPR